MPLEYLPFLFIYFCRTIPEKPGFDCFYSTYLFHPFVFNPDLLNIYSIFLFLPHSLTILRLSARTDASVRHKCDYENVKECRRALYLKHNKIARARPTSLAAN